MIVICSDRVSTLNGHLVINDVVTDVMVGSDLQYRMTCDKEVNYIFIYGEIKNGKIVTYSELAWIGDTVTILPVPNGKTLYTEDDADVKEIGNSGACRVVMVAPGHSKSVVVRHNELMATRYDLETSMETYGLFEALR